ncbi:uncharacterized protein [Argopecten irradians]|uniref:uncharacterized protein n=1 Tax=Argopecten irradians TaxID=31199 RepID=UPI003716EE7C
MPRRKKKCLVKREMWRSLEKRLTDPTEEVASLKTQPIDIDLTEEVASLKTQPIDLTSNVTEEVASVKTQPSDQARKSAYELAKEFAYELANEFAYELANELANEFANELANEARKSTNELYNQTQNQLPNEVCMMRLPNEVCIMRLPNELPNELPKELPNKMPDEALVKGKDDLQQSIQQSKQKHAEIGDVNEMPLHKVAKNLNVSQSDSCESKFTSKNAASNNTTDVVYESGRKTSQFSNNHQKKKPLYNIMLITDKLDRKKIPVKKPVRKRVKKPIYNIMIATAKLNRKVVPSKKQKHLNEIVSKPDKHKIYRRTSKLRFSCDFHSSNGRRVKTRNMKIKPDERAKSIASDPLKRLTKKRKTRKNSNEESCRFKRNHSKLTKKDARKVISGENDKNSKEEDFPVELANGESVGTSAPNHRNTLQQKTNKRKSRHNIDDKNVKKQKNENSEDVIITKDMSIQIQKRISQLSNQTHCIFASYSQSDSTFPSISRGRQCTCNSLMMLLYARHCKSFTTDVLDEVLHKGDELYHTVISDLQASGNFRSYLLQFEELPSDIHTSCYKCHIEKQNMFVGIINNLNNSNLLSLHSSVCSMFEQDHMGLITIGSITSAFWKTHDGYFHFFDSHPHGNDLLDAQGGKAILCTFPNITDLVGYMKKYYASLNLSADEQFEIQPLVIHTDAVTQQNETPLSLTLLEKRKHSNRFELLNKYFEDQKYFNQAKKETSDLTTGNNLNITDKSTVQKKMETENTKVNRRNYYKKYKQNQRSNENYRNRERKQGHTSKQKARTNDKYRAYERMKEQKRKQKARTNDEYRASERTKENKRKQRARTDDDYRACERLKEVRVKQKVRLDDEYRASERAKEKESKRRARTVDQYRTSERTKERKNKQRARTDDQYRTSERTKEMKSKQKARADDEYRTSERTREKKIKRKVNRKQEQMMNTEHLKEQEKRKSSEKQEKM